MQIRGRPSCREAEPAPATGLCLSDDGRAGGAAGGRSRSPQAELADRPGFPGIIPEALVLQAWAQRAACAPALLEGTGFCAEALGAHTSQMPPGSSYQTVPRGPGAGLRCGPTVWAAVVHRWAVKGAPRRRFCTSSLPC